LENFLLTADPPIYTSHGDYKTKRHWRRN
jgi:hypothetical protein